MEEKLKTKFVKTFEEIFVYSWWVVLFAFLCYMVYSYDQKKRHYQYQELLTQLRTLEKQKLNAEKLKTKYLMELNSQSDPAWVELILMKGLGVVPEGQNKVYFKQ